MNQNYLNASSIITEKSPLIGKISLLRENNLDWKEIGHITGLPAKFIKRISDGTHTVKGAVNDLLESIFDDAIAKLHISPDTCNDEYSPEVDQHLGAREYHKMEVKSISIISSKDDDKFVIQIHGAKLHH